MKIKWLNLILSLTNKIYSKKKSVIEKVGLGAAGTILDLILLEILLAVVSLPLYFGTKTSGVIAFFREKGGYEKISSDYRLRRVITLSGVTILFVIWLVKYALIILTPAVYGPMQLYSISELDPVEVNRRELVIQDTGMQTARVVETLAIPTINRIDKKNSGEYIFSGTGIPGNTAVLFMVGQKTLMYSDIVGADGKWQLSHLQKDFKLQDGIQSVFALHYDKQASARSKTSSEQYFRVKTSFLEAVSRNIDSVANFTVVFFIAIGIFLTFLTL